MTTGDANGGRVGALVRWLMNQHRWVLAISGLLLLITGYRTALTYGSLRSELEELLPRSAPIVSSISDLRRRLPFIRFFFLLIDVD